MMASTRSIKGRNTATDGVHKWICTNPWMRFGVAALATWRVSHLLASEDGPGEVIARAREKLGDSQMGQLMDCFQCTSIWVAAPFAFYVAKKPVDRFAAWLALSAAACLLNDMTSREDASAGGDHELLWKQTPGAEGNIAPRPAALSWPGNS
jgi:Protein of unknown function (DUF1360)